MIARILSRAQTDGVAYAGKLLQSGVPRYILAGPKVAFTAMAIEALSDFGREVSAWRNAGRIPEDFSGRPPGYQTWVELLIEKDSNPTDAERLKALKAMFLAANRIDGTEGESVVAYQLFQVAKKLNAGELLLLTAVYEGGKAAGWPRSSATLRASDWRTTMGGWPTLTPIPTPEGAPFKLRLSGPSLRRTHLHRRENPSPLPLPRRPLRLDLYQACLT